MNKSDRRKLAKAARELAMECVAGTAPEFGQYRLYLVYQTVPVCVLGHLYFRFHGRAEPPDWLIKMEDRILPLLEVVVDANNDSAPPDRHGAVVFPLLAIADELESAS